MVDLIPTSVRQACGSWNIGGAVMASLVLQTTLILVSPFRKCTSRKLIFIIWSSYLLADTIIAYAVSQISDKHSDFAGSDNGNLVAFWTPFLLVQWRRHTDKDDPLLSLNPQF